jgi:hypothetical protein
MTYVVAVGNFLSKLGSYRDGSWSGVATTSCSIYAYQKLLRLEKLVPKKLVWFRFCGWKHEVGSKSPTKHSLRIKSGESSSHAIDSAPPECLASSCATVLASLGLCEKSTSVKPLQSMVHSS